MPKKISQHELKAIVELIAKFPNGASIQDVMEKSYLTLPKRTLQRRLAQLVTTHRIMAIGQGKAIRYQILPNEVINPIKVSSKTEQYESIYIPISTAGSEIKQLVKMPIPNRQPAGYNQKFLDAYIPNTTMYLSPEIQRYLHQIGQAPHNEWPAGTHARQVFNRLLIDLSWNSSRLEGNTYSLLETERLIELGEIAEGKAAFETQMILNHKAAIEFLVDMAEEIAINRPTILNIHALLANNLLAPKARGNLRTIQVNIGKSVYYPLGIPQLIQKCFQQIVNTASAIQDPFEQAFFLMVHLPYLQPFEDVNKRVSRLAANIPFIKHNLSPIAFVDVPEHAYVEGILGVYELNRIELLRDVFVWAYERSAARYPVVCQSMREPDVLHLRYHALIMRIIASVIRERLNKKEADIFIKKQVSLIESEKDRLRLIEIIETELGALHEGNLICYRIPPTEFFDWLNSWK